MSDPLPKIVDAAITADGGIYATFNLEILPKKKSAFFTAEALYAIACTYGVVPPEGFNDFPGEPVVTEEAVMDEGEEEAQEDGGLDEGMEDEEEPEEAEEEPEEGPSEIVTGPLRPPAQISEAECSVKEEEEEDGQAP
jgi:hypothetical protein